jgi:hypothetical protein
MSKTATEAFDRFQKTVELLSRNKVTKANAFENRLLDINSKLLQVNSKDASEEKWRDYSTIVDACGKVYGFCVDHIHEETLKILGGVSRTYDTETAQDERPQFQQRRQTIHGTRTIESNESALNMKEWDRSEKYDPDFTSMKKTFDSNKSSTMLLNTITLNSNLDLICSPEDKVIVLEDYPLPVLMAVDFQELTENQLFNGELCDNLQEFLKKTLVVGKEFQEVWENVQSCGLDLPAHDSEPSDVEEVRKTNKQQLQETFFEIDLAAQETNIIIPSSGVVFSKDFVEKNVIRKVKKRKPKPALKESNFDYPVTILKVEIDLDGENLMPREEGGNDEKEEGYREERLAQLFTRHGKSVGVAFGRQIPQPEDWEVFNETENEVKIENNDRKMDLDIRLVKEKVSLLIKNKRLKDFSSVLNELPYSIDFRTLENLSIHSCFVTLLHIANEQSLVFEKSGECDFKIKKFH